MNTARCNHLTLYSVNNMSGDYLHSMGWVEDKDIGTIPQEWNFLEGYTDPDSCRDTKLVHFTLGTPDMVDTPSEYSHEWWYYATRKSIFGANTWIHKAGLECK